MAYTPDPIKNPEFYENAEPKYHSIKESFRWITDELTVNDAPGNKVIIRGPALFSIEKFFKKGISKNRRRYILDEIRRSARTLKGVPIDVNHEISLWEEQGKTGRKPQNKGHALFGEEEDGQLEYVAEINHKEYSQKIRDTDKVRKGFMTTQEYLKKWGKLPLAGVSVDADYLKLKCWKCGDDFYNGITYKNHMLTEHGIKDISIEPRGIVFKRLSLVEPPESPGVEGATFEIVETTNDGMKNLYEIMIKEHGGKPEMETTEKVEKRGNQWCVIHCHGPDTGKPIRCFDTEAEAQTFHGYIQKKTKESGHQVFIPDPLTEDQVEKDAAAKDEEGENPPTHPVLPDAKAKPKEEKADTIPDTEPEEPEPTIDEVPLTVGELTKKVNELLALKAVFERLLAEADRNAEMRDEKIMTLEQRLKQRPSPHLLQRVEELEQKVNNTKETPLTETESTKSLLEKALIRIDNLEDKIKPQFKGHSQRITESEEKEDKPLVKDPITKR